MNGLSLSSLSENGDYDDQDSLYMHASPKSIELAQNIKPKWKFSYERDDRLDNRAIVEAQSKEIYRSSSITTLENKYSITSDI